MSAIYKREVQGYFSSMMGYIIVAALTALIGVFFTAFNLMYGYSSFSRVMQTMIIVMIFAVPVLTMRSFSEERKLKTDQLLLTAPVKLSSIVLGKFLSVMTVIAIPLIISCLCPIIISFFGEASLLKDYSTILAMLCMCGLFASIGIFISSLTENQIVAVFVTIFVLFLLYMLDALIAFIPETSLASVIGFLLLIALVALVIRLATRNNGLTIIITIGLLLVLAFFAGLGWESMAGSVSAFLKTFAVMTPLQNFVSYSVFDLKGIFYYLTFTALFLFLTVQSIQKRRWN